MQHSVPDPILLRRSSDITPEEHNLERESIELRLRVGDDRMNNMETLIKENTALTREVKEILDLGKNFFKILHILGRVFKWVATIGAGFAAILTLWHNLPPPGGK